MGFGALIRNGYGQEMVAGVEKCFVFLSKHVVSTPGNGSVNIPGYTGSIAPLVFAHNGQMGVSTTSGVLCEANRSGSGWKIDYLFGPNGTATFYVFIPIPNVETASYGISIWNENGELSFHTGYKILRAEGFATFRTDVQAPPGGGHQIDSGLRGISKPATISPRRAWWVVPQSEFFGEFRHGHHVYNNGITYVDSIVQPGPPVSVAQGFTSTGSFVHPVIDASKYD